MNRGVPLPAIPTWKAKHSADQLRPLMTDLATFNRAYRMMSIAPGELLFPSFDQCCVPGMTSSELTKQNMPAYVGVDLSSAQRPGNAIVVVGLRYPELRRVLLEVVTGAWSSPKTAQVLAEVCSRHNVQFIQVENNAYQQALIDWVQKEKPDFPYWMKIEAFTTGASKSAPQYGLPGIEVEFHNKGWIFPLSEWETHETTCVCDWCHLRDEFQSYPKGKTSDVVMATWFARDALNKWAPPVLGAARRGGSLNQR